MNEFLPRTAPISPATNAQDRGAAMVGAISSAKSTGNDAQGEASFAIAQPYRTSAAADYAKIQADIADVLASIKPSAAPASAANDANNAILAMMPNPVVMLPMPPTDAKMVAFVAQVAQSLALQAAQARAAQAVATPIMTEAAAH